MRLDESLARLSQKENIISHRKHRKHRKNGERKLKGTIVHFNTNYTNLHKTMQRALITQSTFCATNFTNAIRMVRGFCVEINARTFKRENGEKLTIEIFRDLTPSI